MADFRFYSPEDVIYANLQDTTGQMDMLCEQERAHLRELAREITKDLSDPSELPLSLSDLLPEKMDLPLRALTQNTEILARLHPFHDIRQTVLLCMEICAQLHQTKGSQLRAFFSEPEGTAESLPDRIIYSRSTYSDAAYLRFASLFADPRAIYTHSFPVACEEVHNGICRYCILPLENSTEGQLNSFARLIDRYELKIVCTCNVTASDGSRTTRFALLRREILPLFEEDGTLFFEFATPTQTGISISALLYAAELCGLHPERIDSRPKAVNGDKPSLTRFVLRIGNGDLTAFLLFLFSKAPLTEPIGIYPHMKDAEPIKHGKEI